MLCLRRQIAAQERRNIDLAAFNTSFRKSAPELREEMKDFFAKIVELKSKNEELSGKNVELEKENVELKAKSTP